MIELEKLLPIIFPLLFTIPFFLIFLLLLWAGIRGAAKSKASQHWPSVPGQITESYIKEKRKKDGIRYKPRVRYTYVVMGKSYTARTINFGGRKSIESRAEADQYIRPYRTDTDIPVYYNPRKPAEACLVRGGGYGWLLTLIGGGGLLCIVGIWICMLGTL